MYCDGIEIDDLSDTKLTLTDWATVAVVILLPVAVAIAAICSLWA